MKTSLNISSFDDADYQVRMVKIRENITKLERTAFNKQLIVECIARKTSDINLGVVTL
jgi:hypothetical protein